MSCKRQVTIRDCAAPALTNDVEHPLDLIQGSGKSCGQMIRQEAEGAMPLGAVPAQNQGSRRRDPQVLVV